MNHDARTEHRFATLAYYVNAEMDFITEFKESPFADFNKDGLIASLLVKQLTRHFGMTVTPKESEILMHIASGHSKEHICAELFIEPDTFAKHKGRLRTKFENAGFDIGTFDLTVIMALSVNRVMGQLI